MGNNISTKIYDMIMKDIIYNTKKIIPKNNEYYYIEKKWYNDFCDAVNKKQIEIDANQLLKNIQYSQDFERKTFSPISVYSINKKKYNTLPKEFNLNIQYREVEIFGRKKEKILDISKYQKIMKELFINLLTYFNCVNTLKCNDYKDYIKIVIINDKEKITKEKYIEIKNNNLNQVQMKIEEYLKKQSYKEYEIISNSVNLYLIIKNNQIEPFFANINKDGQYEIKKEDLRISNLYNSGINYIEYLNQKKKYNEKKININDLFGTMGISNIGNNNFMNCCFQVLSNFFPLTIYFLTDKYKNNINYDNPNSSNGNVTIAFAELIKILWTQKLKLSNFNNKECYYFDQNQINEKEKVSILIKLKNEIGNHNCIYLDNNFNQNAIEFLNYLIDTIHEDLNSACLKENTYNINFNYINYENNSQSLNDLYDEQYRIFKSLNDSIMINYFYAISLTTIKCYECKSNYYFFDQYNIITLPLNESPIKALENDLNIFHEKYSEKSKIKIPGKNNFYFCKCVIIPLDNSKEKKIIVCPIHKREYAQVILLNLIKRIGFILNVEIYDLVTAILSEDKNYFKFICTGYEYLYQVFKKPDNLVIYFIQLNNRSSLELRKEMRDNNNLLNYFLKPMNDTNNNLFSYGEVSTKTYISLTSNVESLNYVKLISMIKKENSFSIIQLPKIMSINRNESMKTTYLRICYLYSIKMGFENFEYLNNEKLYTKIEDLNQFLKNKNHIPFILFFEIESEKNLDIPLEEHKGFYIPIPYSMNSLINYGDRVSNLIKNDGNSNFYIFRRYRIIIIWLKNIKNILALKDSMKIENMKEINPYPEVNKNSIINKSEKKDKLELTDLLKYYTQYEKYDKQNIWFCEKCNQPKTALKRTLLYTLPEVLIFYFQRKTNEKYNNIKITFPFDNLNLRQFCVNENSKEKLFELISIIIYKEENKPNNYSVYCKNPILKKWFLFCDTECYPINNIEEEIKYEEIYAVIYQNKNIK